MAVWRIRSLHLSRTESRCVVGSMTYGVVWDQLYGTLQQLALPECRAFIAYTGDDTAIHGAACYLPDRIGHLYKCRPPAPSDIMQPGDGRLHWLPIAVDGTSRHEASYAHYTLGGTAGANQLSSWWLLGGCKKWETLYAASQHQEGGKSWVSVCKTWWENFASMCVAAWRSAWFSGADLGRLRNHSIAMGTTHNELQWDKLCGRIFGLTTCIILQRSGEYCQSSPTPPLLPRGA